MRNRLKLADMRRVAEIRQAGKWDAVAAIDRVVLDSADRRRRRVVLTGERGTAVLVDLPQPVMLKDGDGLVLDDGAIMQVVGQPESLLELGMRTPLQLVRLAWHLGNRHTDVQIPASGCASGATTCWRIWRRASAPR